MFREAHPKSDVRYGGSGKNKDEFIPTKPVNAALRDEKKDPMGRKCCVSSCVFRIVFLIMSP